MDNKSPEYVLMNAHGVYFSEKGSVYGFSTWKPHAKKFDTTAEAYAFMDAYGLSPLSWYVRVLEDDNE